MYKQKKNRRTRKYKPKNCAPNVKNKTIHSKSCYSPNMIENLKSLYNKRYSNKIIAIKPKQIWNELKKRMKNCDSESCWLKELAEPNVSARIEKQVFAPRKPSSWLKNPNEWLTNFDIKHVLHQYENFNQNFEFIGPSFIDFNEKENGTCVDEEVCKFDLSEKMKNKIHKIGIVFNLDKHYMSGSHWVSLFIDVNDRFIFYFDSAGDKTPKEIKALVDNIQNQGEKLGLKLDFHENHPFEHQYGNTECGMYSLYFIISLLTNKVNNKVFKTKEEKIHFFKKVRISDKEMEILRNKYYN